MFALIWIVGILLVSACTTPAPPPREPVRRYGSDTPEDIEYLDQVKRMSDGEAIQWEEI